MNRIETSPGLSLFGNLVNLDCHIQDLKLVLKKTEEIEFPEHRAAEGETLVADIFPDIMRSSFVVTLLIALDDQFKTYCEILRNAMRQGLKWNDLKGSALQRFIAYSEKVCGLHDVCDDHTRQLVEGLVEVRNCIVHNNSALEGFAKADAVKQFAKQVKGVRIDDGYISFDVAACNTCADIVLKFMEGAYHSALNVFPHDR